MATRVGLRRPGNRRAPPAQASEQSDNPVPVVFRVHSDTLSKASFLFNPKNFGLAPPVGATKDDDSTAIPVEGILEIVPTQAAPNSSLSVSAAVAGSGGGSGGGGGGGGSGAGVPTVSSDHKSFHTVSSSSTLANGSFDPASIATAAAVAAAQTFPSSSAAAGGNSTSAAPSSSAAAPLSVADLMSGVLVPPGLKDLLHPSGCWLCHAMAFSEREANHANGAISVNNALMTTCPLVNELAKGRAVARVVRGYDEARRRFGLSHALLSLDRQFFSRSDMFLIAEALQGRVLYSGEVMQVCGFRLHVHEILQTAATGGAAPAVVTCGLVTPSTRINFQTRSPVHYVIVELGREMWETTMDGRIALTWAIQKFIRELVTVQLARRKAAPLLRFIFSGRLAAPYTVRGRTDMLHMLNIPADVRTGDITDEVQTHCELFTERLLCEIKGAGLRALLEAEGVVLSVPHAAPAATSASATSDDDEDDSGGENAKSERRVLDQWGDAERRRELFQRLGPHAREAELRVLHAWQHHWETLTAKDIFTSSKTSNTLETVSIVLERCNHHHIDRRLNITGHKISVVSAGKAVYAATNRLIQVTCARLHDVGLDKINVVCVGRPPLHTTPLLEYDTTDETLRAQYSLHHYMRRHRHVHECPEWVGALFYHPLLNYDSGETKFALLSKEEWAKHHSLFGTATVTSATDNGSSSTSPLAAAAAAAATSTGGSASAAAVVANASEELAPSNAILLGSGDLPHAMSMYGEGMLTPGLHLRDLPLPPVLLPQRPKTTTTISIPSPAVVGSVPGGASPPGTMPPGTVVRSEWFCVRHHRFPTRERNKVSTASSSPAAAVAAATAVDDDKACVGEAGERLCKAPTSTRLDAASCGDNIIDTDVRHGNLVLELSISPLCPLRWLPDLVCSDAGWRDLLSCFSGRDDQLAPGEDEAVGTSSGFRAAEALCSMFCGITSDGCTLVLPTHRNDIEFSVPERIIFTPKPSLFQRPSAPTKTSIADANGGPSWGGDDSCHCCPIEPVTIAYVQLRYTLLFSIKPVNPLWASPSDTEFEPSENVGTNAVFRRRWQFQHPLLTSEAPEVASWSRLCVCLILPVYGRSPIYSPDIFYSISTHQYSVAASSPAEERRSLLEFVQQRLQQQYQIVLEGSGTDATAPAQWPRAPPTPYCRLELSLGHQVHAFQLNETVKSISVTRRMHPGMYRNNRVTHMQTYRYALWNYLDDSFSKRDLQMEAQIGEKNAYRWEALDRWLQDRPAIPIPRGPDFNLRAREVAVVLLPRIAGNRVRFETFHRFIAVRFSAFFTTRLPVEWEEHPMKGLRVPERFANTPDPPSLMHAVLEEEDAPQSSPGAAAVRHVVDAATGRTLFFGPATGRDRLATVDIDLPHYYHEDCCYYVRVSWLACAATMVEDWYGTFVASAGRFGLKAIPIPCHYQNPKSEPLVVQVSVVAETAEEQRALRVELLRLLISRSYFYYPDSPNFNRNCRLVHHTGLCYVLLPLNSRFVAQWLQNSGVREGSMAQVDLLAKFREAVGLAKETVRLQQQ